MLEISIRFIVFFSKNYRLLVNMYIFFIIENTTLRWLQLTMSPIAPVVMEQFKLI
jgi:hypothetical protein